MKSNSLLLPVFLLLYITAYSQPAIEWQKSLGGSGDDKAYSVQQTFDGGYIVAGYSLSNNGDVSGNHGGDYWIVKLDANSTIQWDKCYGGTGVDWPYSIRQTTDSGYFIVGYSTSKDGDVTGLHGVNADYWALKLSSTGNLEWQKCLGGTGDDKAYAGQQTADGGYIVAGYSGSKDGDVSGNHSIFTGSDDWIVKLDSTGNIEWAKCFGGSANDYAEDIKQTFDGGYIVTGYTISNDSDVSGNHSLYDWDYWVVKINGAGLLQWQKCLGGSKLEESFSVQQTADSGYIVAGETISDDSDVSGNHWVFGPYSDYWVVKLSPLGDIQWQKCYGGNNSDWAQSIQQTSDGGYIMTGIIYSHDGEVSCAHAVGSYADYWVVKTDAAGNLEWRECLGGTTDDQAYSVHPTMDGGYIVAGYSNSIDGDVTGNHGNYDYWVVKLAAPLGIKEANETLPGPYIYPNPFSSSALLQFGGQIKDADAVVCNMLGEELMRKRLTGNRLEIDRGNLASGIYMIRVTDGKNQWVKKMIIE